MKVIQAFISLLSIFFRITYFCHHILFNLLFFYSFTLVLCFLNCNCIRFLSEIERMAILKVVSECQSIKPFETHTSCKSKLLYFLFLVVKIKFLFFEERTVLLRLDTLTVVNVLPIENRKNIHISSDFSSSSAMNPSTCY